MDHNLRAVMRKSKGVALGYSEIEGKVREATSNDPWGAPSAILEEIAHATHSPSQLKQIMEMIWKRMNDSGKNWRHVMKALTLLDYLIKNGSETCVEYARDHVHDIRTLKEFQYIDENGKDQGINVRHKSKEIATLLGEPDRIKEEREKAKYLRQRLAGSSASYSGGYGNSDYTPSSTQSGQTNYYGSESRNSESPNRRNEEEDPEIQRAIQESKATYEAERMERLARERSAELQRSSSRKDSAQASVPTPTPAPRASQQPKPAPAAADPFGADPFGSDPFGSDPFGNKPAPQARQSVDLFGSEPFAPQQPKQAAPKNDPFGNGFAAQPAKSNDPFGGVDPFASSQSDPFGSKGFQSAFDGGNEAKPLPHQLANANDPNAKLAAVARNSVAIDPFAQIASSRSTTTPGGFGQPAPASGFGQPAPGFGQPAPGFGQPAPGFGQPAPGFGQPAPGFGQPTSGFGQPGYGQPAAGFGQPIGLSPSPAFGQPAYGQPAGFGQPTGGFGQPAGFGQPSPAFGQPAPGFGQPSPAFGQPAGINPFGASPVGQQRPPSSNPFGGSVPSDPFGDLGPTGVATEILVPDNKQAYQKKYGNEFDNIVNLENLGAKQYQNNPFAAQKDKRFDWGENKGPGTKPLNELKSNQGSFF